MHGKPVKESSQIAVALLFWEVANVDGDMNGKEHEELLYWLDRDFALASGEATKLLELVLALEGGSKHLDSHIGEINRVFSTQQKEHLFLVLLEICSIDSEINGDEKDLTLEIREKLNLPIQG